MHLGIDTPRAVLPIHNNAGKAYAVKSIPKVLTDPGVSEAKRGSHLTYLKREVEVMLALRGTLNVACLEVSAGRLCLCLLVFTVRLTAQER